MDQQIEWFKWLWGAVFIPFILHLYKKIDRAVDRDEYNATIKSLRDEVRNGNEAIADRMDRIMAIMIEKK